MLYKKPNHAIIYQNLKPKLNCSFMTSKINTLSLLSLSTLRFVFLRQKNFEPQLDSKMFSLLFSKKRKEALGNQIRYNTWFSGILSVAGTSLLFYFLGELEEGVLGAILCFCGVGYLIVRGNYTKETRGNISRLELKNSLIEKIKKENILNKTDDEDILLAIFSKIETAVSLSKKRNQRKMLVSIFKLLEELALKNDTLFLKTKEGLKTHSLNPNISDFLVKIDLKRKERMWEEKDKKKEAVKQLSFAEN